MFVPCIEVERGEANDSSERNTEKVSKLNLSLRAILRVRADSDNTGHRSIE